MNIFPGTCRIWDKKKKEWIESKVVIEPTLGNVWNPHYQLGRCAEYPDCIIQYWTGMYDYALLFTHNPNFRPKQIFEGDIVRGYFPDGTTVRSIFVVKWNQTLCKFNLSRDLIISRKLQVIGNILENPDLIPEKFKQKVLGGVV